MSFLKRKSKPTFVAPAGLTTAAPRIFRSVPFTFDTSGEPAVNESKISLVKPAGLSLSKSFKATTDALLAVQLPGIRFQVIVLLDGSGSMGREYERHGDQSPVERLLVRSLGFALNVDADGAIPVIVYGHGVAEPIDINLANFENAGNLVRPDFGLTNMAGAFRKALAMAEMSNQLTLIINITDGNPYTRDGDNALLTKNEVIRSAGMPVMIKNLAIKSVPFLEEIDDLPSKYEIRKNPDETPMTDNDGRLVIDINEKAFRLIDNVDSKEIDPYKISDEDFAKALADEIAECLEVMARVGILTTVPGIEKEYELV